MPLNTSLVNDFAADMFRERLGTENLSITYLALSGAIAGTCQVIATNPMEVVKINMQMQAQGAAPVSYGQLIRELGLSGLYRGVSATLLRYVPLLTTRNPFLLALTIYLYTDLTALHLLSTTEIVARAESSDVPFSLLYFGSYGWLRQKLQDEKGNLSMGNSFAAGLSAGVFASGSVTPADVIKTRLQSKTPAGVEPYKGIVNTASRIIANEGAPALFKGVFPRVLVISPLFAITLAIFEIQKTFLKKL